MGGMKFRVGREALGEAVAWVARALLGGPAYTGALRLVLLNTFAMGFTFLPFHVLRIERRAVTFSLLTLARSVSTIVLRLILVIGLGMQVLGIVLADLIVTMALMIVLIRWFAPLVRLTCRCAVGTLRGHEPRSRCVGHVDDNRGEGALHRGRRPLDPGRQRTGRHRTRESAALGTAPALAGFAAALADAPGGLRRRG